jgi:soluble lytic murein transglycosylase-like protein
MNESLPLCSPDSHDAATAGADAMSSPVNELVDRAPDVVRLLPLGPIRMKQRDYRIICNCQQHAAQQRVWWRRGLRAMRQVKSGSVALLVGVPLIFGATWIPMDAGYAAALKRLSPVSFHAASSRAFPVFTTERVRRDFLTPNNEPQVFTREISKEAFFRAHVPYGQIIYREARRNNLPPELVAAVVESESDFRVGLVSNKNAQGLMQLVPETGRLMGAANLFNPEQNIAAGTKYLRYLFDRFGDERTVLAAYNAGEGNIEKFGGVPPFPETLSYLDRVKQRTRSYAAKVHGSYVTAARLHESLEIAN